MQLAFAHKVSWNCINVLELNSMSLPRLRTSGWRQLNPIAIFLFSFLAEEKRIIRIEGGVAT